MKRLMARPRQHSAWTSFVFQMSTIVAPKRARAKKMPLVAAAVTVWQCWRAAALCMDAGRLDQSFPRLQLGDNRSLSQFI